MLNINSISRRNMTSALIFALASASGTIASAVTISELATKNNELQALEVDLAIAKKKSDLAPYTAPKTSLAVKAVKRSATADVDTLLMTEIFGDVINPTAEFNQNGSVLVRRRGDSIGDWTIQSIRNRQAILVKAGKSSKDSITKTVYLSAKPQPVTYGQIEARSSASPIPMPLPVFSQPK